MKDDIKEILDNMKEWSVDGELYFEINDEKAKLLFNYITNLQEEIENLREEDWAWHQTLKAQNNREYRSKFLKEFQKEYNTSTYPDYDEIYKRYDKLLNENERLKEQNEFLKLNNPEMNTRHFDMIKENKRKINNLRAENKKLKQSIVILEKYLELIHDLGYDYDGLNNEHDLKGLIDEMVRFASLGRAYNTTEEIYVDGKGKPLNILGEELKKDNE